MPETPPPTPEANAPGADAPGADPPVPPETASPGAPEAPPVTVYGEGTPVVLLHAFPLDSRMWLHQVEALAGYQVIVPDLRGFGSARRMAVEVAHMDLLADDLASLLDERGLERVALCGTSMGGYVALAFARRHPGRLGGLVLCDTRAGADTEETAANRLAMAERVLAEGVDFVPEALLPRLLGRTSHERRPELVEQVATIIRDQDPRAVAAGQRGMAARRDSTPFLGQVEVPTLVIVGAEDELTRPEEARALAAGIRGARLVQVEQAGHLATMEQPGPVNEALLDFLAPLWI